MMRLFCCLWLVLSLGTIAPHALAEGIDFNRDIRPLLSDRCFLCHGPAEETREADLRFDTEEGATGDLGGYHAIDREDPQASELLLRILSDDPDERMPPSELNKPLKPKEIELFRRWILQGAPWAEHWAYVPPVQRDLPAVKDNRWPLESLDHVVLARLESEGLRPSPEADRVTLIRRLSFDLCGLPPSVAEVNQFVTSTDPDAYEKLIDRMLASEQFGERMAIWWLDLVRFADTVGYHGDQTHRAWPYRDYVIGAFNSNMRFDQFTAEQLAGDLLPEPTQNQLAATCYNRLLQTSHEGGVQVKEYRAIYMADRVRNVSQVWMGATVGCAQCHDHKYDPYTATDFYSLGAFFADIDDENHLAVGSNDLPTNRSPELSLFSAQQQAESLRLEQQLQSLRAEHKQMQDTATAKQSAWETEIQRLNPQLQSTETKTSDALPAEVLKAMQVAHSERTAKQIDLIRAYYLKTLPEYRKSNNRIKQHEAQIQEIKNSAPQVMITETLAEPRTVRLLPRGDWLDESGPTMQPAIPKFLGSLQVGDARATRLDLAKWLVAPSAEGGVGELTARVQANRFWYLLMGGGISRVLDDFGGQGEPPANPELLDALGQKFFESGWDVKHMMKHIAMSRTYRQSSLASQTLQQLDPNNRLYARQARPRLPAEMIRDNVLAISGLLIQEVGGASVNPYQPVGYYRHLNFPQREYSQHSDDRQWRRGLYVHWQRQFLNPMLKAFDAPSREECTAQRPQSNTPVAALTLLNDPTFIEAARSFAERILTEGGKTTSSRFEFAFLHAVSRKPETIELKSLSELLESSQQYYQANPDDVAKLLATGIKPTKKELNTAELASWTMIARTLLNMNETITRN